jgi:NADPH-dependent 2,4-dienoyl-CoA reductase/sulfur reductase-like enzyme
MQRAKSCWNSDQRRIDVRSYRYLIVGGGMTGDAATRGIRERDADGSIGLVGADPHPPYARPPLSKALWQGKDEDSVWRGTEDRNVDLILGRHIVSLDLDARRATDDQGEEYEYERLLLATGGTPRKLDVAPEAIHFRTLDDYRRLRGAAAEHPKALVVGGGFIGSELAAALQSNGAQVTMVFPDQGVGARLFPAELSRFVTDYYREKGVQIHTGELASRELVDGADVVVAGLGIVPNTQLAEDAGLPVEDGIVVDDRGRVDGREDVFAAGDVARFPVAALGKSMRVEHEDHANSHGRAVGANMAGADTPYDHLPFFYSDLFDLGYEAVGEVDSRLATVEHWKEPGREGVVAYVDGDGKPRGFLLWNVWGKVDDARGLIAAGRPVDESTVEGLAG